MLLYNFKDFNSCLFFFSFQNSVMKNHKNSTVSNFVNFLRKKIYSFTSSSTVQHISRQFTVSVFTKVQFKSFLPISYVTNSKFKVFVSIKDGLKICENIMHFCNEGRWRHLSQRPAYFTQWGKKKILVFQKPFSEQLFPS